jgi:hypothetical protein
LHPKYKASILAWTYPVTLGSKVPFPIPEMGLCDSICNKL